MRDIDLRATPSLGRAGIPGLASLADDLFHVEFPVLVVLSGFLLFFRELHARAGERVILGVRDEV